MNKVKIVNLSNYFANLKLNKFSKEIRCAIISNHLKVNKIVKDFNEAVDEARKKFFSGKEEDLEKLNRYREEYNAAPDENKVEILNKIKSECIEALSLEQEFIGFVNALAVEEVEIEFSKIDMDEFIESCSEANIDITPSDLMNFEEIFK